MAHTLPVLLFAAAAAFAQPQFEVASVKPTPKEAGGRGGNPFDTNIKETPGGVTMRGVTLKGAMEWAYHVFAYQITGPDWVDSDRFEIAAKTPGPASDDAVRAMTQALLADQFGLKFHRQTKEMQAYVLSVGPNGPKFKASTEEGEADIQPDKKTMSITVRRMPLAQIIDPLSRMFQAPVVDNTGLTGKYDVQLNVAKYVANVGPDRGVDPISIIQMALKQDLGLKLEQKKMPVDLLVIDHAQKP